MVHGTCFILVAQLDAARMRGKDALTDDVHTIIVKAILGSEWHPLLS